MRIVYSTKQEDVLQAIQAAHETPPNVMLQQCSERFLPLIMSIA